MSKNFENKKLECEDTQLEDLSQPLQELEKNNKYLNDQEQSKEQGDASQLRYKEYNFLFDEPLTLNNAPSKIINLIKSSIPNVFSQFSIVFFQFTNMYFIQKSNSNLLIGSFGLASTWFQSTCYSAIISLNNGLFTQVSQAYGAENYKLIGQLINKALAIILTFSVLALFIIVETKDILIYLGIKEETANLSYQFVLWLIPSLFLTSLYDCLRNALLGIHKSDIVMKSNLVSYLMHPVWLFIFIDGLDSHIIGMSLSRGLSDLNILLNLLYHIQQERKKCNVIDQIIQPFFTKETFSGWFKYLKVAIPVGSVVYLEWVFYEVTTIVVGILQDDDQLAGHTLFQSTTLFFYMMPLGLSMSVNFFLGSCVGDGKKSIAIKLTKISIFACLLQIIVFIIVGTLIHPVLRSILVSNEEIGFYYDLIYNIYIYGYIIPDYLQAILGAVLRSVGKEQRAMTVFFFGFYVIGVPTVLFITFSLEMEVAGVWFSLIVASGVCSAIFCYDVYHLNWDQCIEEVRKRVAIEQEFIKHSNQDGLYSNGQGKELNDLVIHK